MCQVIKVSKSGYYKWRVRKDEPEEKRMRDLVEQIYTEHKGRYGYRRITAEIKRIGYTINSKRVIRIMKLLGLKAVKPKLYRKTTKSEHKKEVNENILNQNFETKKRDQVWLSDITYIKTSEGWLYLAIVMDLYSRRILGWSLREYMTKEIVIEALSNALKNYRMTADTIFHSDRGVQFTAEEFRAILAKLGITQSMSRSGNCYDNAPMESFFHTLKNELVLSGKLKTRYTTRIVIFEYIEMYYNRRRLHSSLQYRTPDEVYFDK